MKSIYKKGDITIRDSAQNVGRMVARETRKKGEIMEGDEDPAVIDDSVDFSERIDSWLQKRVDAIEDGSEHVKKKAKIYTSNDHGILEKRY